MAVALLQDMSKCMACKACQVACKEWNELPAVDTRNDGSYENPRDLSPATWTRIQFTEGDAGDEPRWLFFKQQCMHCTDAPCVEVCPTAALENHPLGFVSFERDRCNGCGYCVKVCPYGAVRLDTRNGLTGRAKAAKCTLCEDRVTQGRVPACAKACPTGAIQFGDRAALLARGQARVAALRDEGVAGANLYGETELGGLGVLYVLPEPPARYPRALPADPESRWWLATAWQRLLQPAGAIAVGLGALGLVLNFVTVSRRGRERQETDEEGRHAGALPLAVFVVTGLVLWAWGAQAPAALFLASVLLHDLAFVVSFAAFLLHLYLSAVHPLTRRHIGAMVDGTMAESDARELYPTWHTGLATRAGRRP